LAWLATDGARIRGWWRRLAIVGGVAVYALLCAPSATESAIANGETRTLNLINNHTNESGTFTYRVNGSYDSDVLDKLNWFLRDWRLNEQTKMDPRLFDILWEVYQQSGSTQPIDVLSAYRSPQTNAMLRRRSRLVAEHSQHMQGKAIDAHFIDVGPGAIRDVAMRMQEGGVGFYPIGNTPWVHIDSGTVRYWPRISRTQMARLFPDGKTVFIPADGQPMEGYADAKAMIESRGGEVQTASSSGGLFSWLFGGARGGGADDEEESGGARVIASGRGGQMVMTGGRGGMAPALVATAAPAESPKEVAQAPEPARAPPPPPPPPPQPAAPEVVAQGEPAADSDSQPAAAQDPDSADDPAAPLPPRKPVGLLADLNAIAPLPPRRPAEWAIGPTGATNAAANGDLIATLIEHNALPTAISHGVHGAPKSALALVDPQTGAADPNALARAATLSMPPLPPVRPRLETEGVTTAEKSAPTPTPHPGKAARPSAANPWGSLIVDAFSAPAPSASAPPVELRGVSP
jgi:uncharacterized protein YcbK (DUF882 family)